MEKKVDFHMYGTLTKAKGIRLLNDGRMKKYPIE